MTMATPQTQPIRILLVDDEPVIRAIAYRVLISMGFRVLQAPDGPEALRAADAYAGPIHLLLTDVVMPDMTGAELWGHFRERRPNARVLYMSGYPSLPDGEPNLITNEFFLPKPFSTEQLRLKVREALEER